jgi:hypothetical protein
LLLTSLKDAAMRYSAFVALLVVSSMAVACASESISTVVTPIDVPDTNTVAYPAPLTGYPGPGATGPGLPTTPEIPPEAPLPVDGLASVSGVLFSYTIERALPGTQLYLTRAVGEDQTRVPPLITGPELDRGDILGQTNKVGQFLFENIPPANYYMFIWTPSTYTPAQISRDDITPQLIRLAANQRFAMGVVYVAWP